MSLPTLEMAIVETEQNTVARVVGKDAQKLEFSCFTDGNMKWCSSSGGLSCTPNIVCDPTIPTLPRYIPKRGESKGGT